ncbi:hypothetical protein D3C81_1465300 [compost metagenome]
MTRQLLVNFLPSDLAEPTLMLVLVALCDQQRARRLTCKVEVLVGCYQIHVDLQFSEDLEHPATHRLSGIGERLIQEHGAVKRTVAAVGRQHVSQAGGYYGSGKRLLFPA